MRFAKYDAAIDVVVVVHENQGCVQSGRAC